MVDNYDHDVIGARRAGLIPILIDPFDVVAEQEVVRIKELGELLKILEKWHFLQLELSTMPRHDGLRFAHSVQFSRQNQCGSRLNQDAAGGMNSLQVENINSSRHGLVGLVASIPNDLMCSADRRVVQKLVY